MFILSKDIRNTLKECVNAKILSTGESPIEFISRLVPDKIADPERHEGFARALQEITQGESLLDIDTYHTITEEQFALLHYGLTQIRKLLSGASIANERTLITPSNLEKIAVVLVAMTKEDAERLYRNVQNITETKAGKIARKVHSKHPENSKMNERYYESEWAAQKFIQSTFYNDTVDRITACRTMVNVIHEIQEELRKYARTLPVRDI